MKYIAIDNGLKINTLEYNTFEIDGFESGEQILENQSVDISIKSGVNKQNELKRVFLFDIFIEGKNELLPIPDDQIIVSNGALSQNPRY